MMEYYINEMIKEDVVFITASGNDDREEVAVCALLVTLFESRESNTIIIGRQSDCG